ncbi:hypothetical protein [Vulcanisaeta sp. JCM 16161]|uniref:hypothetical protein n=1 Tax=Vulcanisaeta sp. JCM 16161 TaxID=1295372 RepID=UPI0006D24401|nr:hypothetical protein [Vulcanisaeta sp. JCM 16161]
MAARRISNETWNEVGLAGLKILMGLALIGGVGGWMDVVGLTRVGRARGIRPGRSSLSMASPPRSSAVGRFNCD